MAVDLDRRGNVQSPTGCDPTYPANARCLDDVLAQHPTLEGVDGIALDEAGNIWPDPNERNAVVAIDHANRRDNSPNTAGESAGTGKITCLDPRQAPPLTARREAAGALRRAGR